mgnify:CR=1 FL=1
MLSGVCTGCNVFVDSVGIAALLFASPALDMHLDTAVKQHLVGFAVAQGVLAHLARPGRTTRPVIAPPGYEMVPGLLCLVSHVAATITAGAPTHAELLSTVLIAVALVSATSALLLACASSRPRALAQVPESVRVGILAHVGLHLFELAVRQATSKGVAELASEGTHLDFALLAPPLGAALALWLVLRSSTAPLIATLAVPGILFLVGAHVHLARLAAGLSLAEAQEQRWLLPSTEGAPLFSLWQAINPRMARWSLLCTPTCLYYVVSAALLPVLSSCLNLALLEQFERPRSVDLRAETRAHGLASFVAASIGGAPCFFSLSCTAVHNNLGAVTRASSWVAVATALALATLRGSAELIGLMPRAIISTTCAYIAFDFVWDGLVSKCAWRADFAWGWLTLALCARLGALGGGVCAIGAHALLVAVRDEVALAAVSTLRTPEVTPTRPPRRSASPKQARTPGRTASGSRPGSLSPAQRRQLQRTEPSAGRVRERLLRSGSVR